MDLFGFEINRKKEDAEKEKRVSFVPPNNEDGALSVAAGGVYGTYVDLDGSVRTEAELVNKYRSISFDPIIDLAIQDICNEAIVEDADEETVSIVLDSLKISDGMKKTIIKEFENVSRLLEFNRLSYEIFRRWYIDGRLYYHVIINEAKPSAGISEIRYIDPRNIKKIREVKKEKDKKSGISIEKVVNEYFMYSPSGFLKRSGSLTGSTSSMYGTSGATNSEGIKIACDSIIFCTSGYQSLDNKLIMSWLQKAIRPLNQLRNMEDSMVIYRISRAPERRIFYVDVGGLPKLKAEQYLSEIMTKFKNKTVYDSATGEVKDDRKFMTMLEDFWLPRREGGKGTEITTLPGGQNLSEIEDVVYFQNNLYRSLNVPISRLQPDQTYTLGRATEITRDEIKFSKFITRLRSKFSELFLKILERQLILKGVCTTQDWAEWEDKIDFNFAVDNYFEELKSLEMNRDRIGLLREMEEYVGKYYSHEYMRRYVLQQSESEMKDLDKVIKAEKTDPRYTDPDEEMNGGQEDDSPPPPPPPSRRSPDTPNEPKSEANELDDELTQSQIQLIESMTKYIEDDE